MNQKKILGEKDKAKIEKVETTDYHRKQEHKEKIAVQVIFHNYIDLRTGSIFNNNNHMNIRK